MKKIICSVLVVMMLASLMAGCSKKPSEEEVRTAIESGTLTTEDAVEKGYVTDEWVAAYMQEHTVSASDKFSINQLGAFTAQDINGEDFSFAPSDTPVLFAFADPEDSESLEQIQVIAAAYDEIKSAAGDVVLVLTGEKISEELSDCSIPTIFYTDDLKNQLGSNTEMIDGKSFSASWNMKGAFITAWYGTLARQDLPKTVKDLLDAFAQPASQTDNDQKASVPAGKVN